MERPKPDWSRWAWPACIVALALTLAGPALAAGFWIDDFAQASGVLRWLAGDSGAAWWDLFHLQPNEPARRFGGGLSWWTADDLGAGPR